MNKYRFLVRLFGGCLVCVGMLAACVPGTLSPSSSYSSQSFGSLFSSSIGTPFNQSQLRSPTFSFRGRPATYAEFKSRCQTACTTPQGAVKMYFDAVYCYLEPSRRTEASKMLRYILHQGANWERSPNFSTFVERLREPSWHYVFYSFAADTSPQNAYSMDPDNYALEFSSIREVSSDLIQLNLISSGADSPRLISVRQYEDGLWYMFQNAGTYSEVRKPAGYRGNRVHDTDYD